MSLSMLALAGPGLASASSFLVNSSDDVADGACDSAHCSLRDAVVAANAAPGFDTIAFAIVGTPTIHLASALPALTDPAAIDGWTQPGFVATPTVEVDTRDARGSDGLYYGIRVRAPGSMIRGLIVNGVGSIHVQAGSGTSILGNWLGTDRSGFSAAGTGQIACTDSPGGIIIGGNGPSERNVVAAGYGISLNGCPDSRIENAYVGTDAAGAAGLPNQREGINLSNSSRTIVRDSVISGNGGVGITLDDYTIGAVIEHNLIGLAADGVTPLGNGSLGVSQSDRAGLRLLGARQAVVRGNVISANFGDGIVLGARTYANTFIGNSIGTDASGTLARGNRVNGIVRTYDGGDIRGNTFGGTGLGEGNVVAANGAWGIILEAGAEVVSGNWIGTDRSGTRDLGNTRGGIFAAWTGGAIGPGNVVAFNDGSGIVRFRLGTPITRNSIHSNGLLGIGGVQPTPNDPAFIARNYPVLGSAMASSGGTRVTGSLSTAPNSVYTIELFASSACDPLMHGEGELYLGSTQVTTNSNGTASLDAVVAMAPGGSVITATTTDALGNTSEFSRCSAPLPSDSIPPSVTGTADRAANANGWYAADVLIDWVSVDPVPSSGAPTDPSDTLAGTEGAAVTYTSAASCDPSGNCATGSIALSIDKTAPTIGAPVLAANPVSVGGTTAFSVVAADALSGLSGGEFFVGDDPGVGLGIELTASGGQLSGALDSATPGLHSLGVRSRDRAFNWSTTARAILVVYDPSAGFATGGGWLVPGSSSSDGDDALPGLDGASRANFGFVVKYQKGSSTLPGGNLQFHYAVGDFRLRSSSMDWLVVTNANWARFQGHATIDASGAIHPFRVDARDGDGSGQPDRFVLKVYAAGADPATTNPVYKASGDVEGGQVMIHR